MWDERYSSEDYAYGKQANQFLAEHYQAIPKGKVLSLAEGEGRNAVFLAQQGYQVTAVDSSRVGLQKAQQLAQAHGVKIETLHADLNDFEIQPHYWDGIIAIFCPMPPPLHQRIHQQVAQGLKPGGIYLLEAYRPEQLQYGTGGGNSAESMMTADKLRTDLQELQFIYLQELEREVIEGVYHTGMGAVVQAIARKP